MAARSPVRSMAGPLVVLMFAPSSLATTAASVVLPRPGGPENRMGSTGGGSTTSPRACAAPMRMASDSLIFVWPR